MIVMKTIGGDLCKAELAPGLVLWLVDTYRGRHLKRDATPEPLDGNGARLYEIVHATDEEREMLREAGVKLKDVDFRWLEAHHRPGRWVKAPLREPTSGAQPKRSRRKTARTRRTQPANVVPLVRAA